MLTVSPQLNRLERKETQEQKIAGKRFSTSFRDWGGSRVMWPQ